MLSFDERLESKMVMPCIVLQNQQRPGLSAEKVEEGVNQYKVMSFAEDLFDLERKQRRLQLKLMLRIRSHLSSEQLAEALLKSVLENLKNDQKRTDPRQPKRPGLQ